MKVIYRALQPVDRIDMACNIAFGFGRCNCCFAPCAHQLHAITIPLALAGMSITFEVGPPCDHPDHNHP